MNVLFHVVTDRKHFIGMMPIKHFPSAKLRVLYDEDTRCLVSLPVPKVVPKDIPVHYSSALVSFYFSYHPLQKGNTDTGEVP